jgi:N4-gp56 family major capsid protein
MAVQTSGDISPMTAAFAVKTMLEHAAPVEVLAKFADVKVMPEGSSKTIKFRRPVPFAAATTPLTEGVTPTGGSLDYEDVTKELQQFGSYVEITDVVADTTDCPVLKDLSMLNGEQAALTKEKVLWGVLKGGTNKFYGGDATSRITVGAGDVMSLTKQRLVTKALKAQKAQKVTSILSGSPNYGTSPIDAAYIAFCHTDLESQIRDMVGFVPVEKYGTAKAMPFEIGSCEGVRYIGSPELEPIAGAGAGGVDVYSIVIIGKNAYGDVAMRGAKSANIMVLNPNSPRGGDPLGQRGTVGWKAYAAPLILNQAWLAVVEVAGV